MTISGLNEPESNLDPSKPNPEPTISTSDNSDHLNDPAASS